jgi:hypothetical protein
MVFSKAIRSERDMRRIISHTPTAPGVDLVRTSIAFGA